MCFMCTVRYSVNKERQEAFEKCWAHSPQHLADVASGTVARRLRIDVYDNANDDDDDNDNA